MGRQKGLRLPGQGTLRHGWKWDRMSRTRKVLEKRLVQEGKSEAGSDYRGSPCKVSKGYAYILTVPTPSWPTPSPLLWFGAHSGMQSPANLHFSLCFCFVSSCWMLSLCVLCPPVLLWVWCLLFLPAPLGGVGEQPTMPGCRQ